ncbi:MAG: NosD domain-containing protein [Dehalococcoidia bacterium]|nr:NosD domain-containing protein [Dehalococcoidia bacterium]
MKRMGAITAVFVLACVSLLLSVFLPASFAPCHVVAQTTAPSFELAYDDGIAWKTIRQSVGGCEMCYEYQGVRFDILGARQAVLTAVRFYAGDPAGTLEVSVTDGACSRLLLDPIQVKVSDTPAWYTVTVPETVVTGDFFVWVKRDGRAMPWHDGGATAHRSYYSEHWNPGVFPNLPLTKGDLMIRARIRAEIHVGVGFDYLTIQEAVGAAGEGMLIVVHEGTYDENVVVNKKLSIMSQDGYSRPLVRPQDSNRSVFTISSDGVMISGFSVQGASGPGAAAFHFDGCSGCTVADNSISGNHYGVLISAGNGNLVVQNDIRSNVYGVWVEGEGNNVAGNHITDNTAPAGSGVYLSALGIGTRVHFNSFEAAVGMEHVVQVYQEGTTQEPNCANNWWGSASGPYPTGTGAAVGEGIRFTPYLTAEPVAVKTATTTPGEYVLDGRSALSTTVLKIGIGSPTIWIAKYAEVPGGEFPTTMIGSPRDIYVSDATNVDQLEIRAYYSDSEVATVRRGSLRIYWWDGAKWKVCSKSGVNTKDGFVWAKIDPKSTPSLSDLSGTPFAVGTTSARFAWWLIPVILLGVLVLLIVVRAVWVLVTRRTATFADTSSH